MPSFCAKCGSPMNQNTGVCDNCGWAPANRTGETAQGGNYVQPQTGNYVPPQTGNNFPPQAGNYVQPQTGNYAPTQTGNYVQPAAQSVPEYTQPQTEQPVYTQPEPAPATAAAPVKTGGQKKKGLLIGIAFVLVLACGIVGGLLLAGGSGDKEEKEVVEASDVSEVSETIAAPEETPAAPEQAPVSEEPAAQEPVVEEQPAEEETPAAPAPEVSVSLGRNVLTEVGSFSGENGMVFVDSIYGLVLREGTDSPEILGYKGESSGIEADYIANLYEGEGQGVVVLSPDGSVGSWGLVDRNGELLIPFETAEIQFVYGESKRYLLVTYVTGETTDESASVYKEDDVMYKGYYKVYDLENRQFVPGVEPNIEDEYDIDCVGDLFLYEAVDGKYYVYDAEGNLVQESSNWLNPGDSIYLESESGTYRVHDGDTGEITFTTKRGISLVSGLGGYISEQQDDYTYALKDRNGNQVLTETYDSIYEVQGNVVRVKDNGQYGLVRLDGTVLVPCDDGDTIYYLSNGYWYRDEGASYTLICPDGRLMDLGDCYPYDMVIEREADDGYDLFVPADGDFTLHTERYPNALTDGLAMVQQNSDRMYGLYDTYTGELLLDFVYEEICYNEYWDCVYAYKNGTWTVYEVGFVN